MNWLYMCLCVHVRIFFLVDDYFFCVLLLFHLNGSQQKQNRFKTENVQFFKWMWMQSMDKLQCDEIEWAQSPLSNTFERWKDEATKKEKKHDNSNTWKKNWLNTRWCILSWTCAYFGDNGMSVSTSLPPAWRCADDDLDTESLIIAHFVTTYNSNGRSRIPWILTRLLS